MIALLKLILFGHLHGWKNLSEHNYYEAGSDMKTPNGKVVIQQCEKCGHLRRVDLH